MYANRERFAVRQTVVIKCTLTTIRNSEQNRDQILIIHVPVIDRRLCLGDFHARAHLKIVDLQVGLLSYKTKERKVQVGDSF